jgi:hypothetical protein
MDVASAERTAGQVGLMGAMHGGQAQEFYVNDVKVSAAEAHAIPANDIATVNVEKGKGAASFIRIRTVAATAEGMKYRSGAPAGSVEPNPAGSMPRTGLHEKIASNHEFGGVILINGVRATAAALHALDPTTIAGVEVIKGAAAAELSSDPAAKNGIIKVTLKSNE